MTCHDSPDEENNYFCVFYTEKHNGLMVNTVSRRSDYRALGRLAVKTTCSNSVMPFFWFKKKYDHFCPILLFNSIRFKLWSLALLQGDCTLYTKISGLITTARDRPDSHRLNFRHLSYKIPHSDSEHCLIRFLKKNPP